MWVLQGQCFIFGALYPSKSGHKYILKHVAPWLVGWLVDWLVGWLVLVWFFGLVVFSFGWFSLVGWLVGWLIVQATGAWLEAHRSRDVASIPIPAS